ncbi:CocE/NonD family hydrolase [Salimicrobium flavidum]|uniref:Xaa-Pro dipeptidyl-peptidase C-terminal domain-containing protein n=1 Tax=Salimicrobium flavidum TaxID=570947 RepID=A0A1N7JIW8_9BACI|nr:CocE/NonD family hydrolase [Salimicrobium flavidum]SIS49204.1 hypothetical protein SAMN05421687_106114 [Salimicrobium flavidum]
MTETIITERGLPCTLRDGTILYANVYRPKESGRFPVLLTRLPYNKDLTNYSHRYTDPIQMAENGYVVIIQDVRGRFASEGVFKPFIHEAEDGYDSVEWAADLPYSNGKVGMFGLSYYGFTQVYAAKEQPPSLKATFPAFTGNDVSRGMSSKPGKLDLGKAQTWFLDSVAPDFLYRIGYKDAWKSLKQDLERIFEWHTYAPVQEWPPTAKYPELHEVFKSYITGSLTEFMPNPLPFIKVPGFHMAGWFDCFLDETITNYTELSNSNYTQKLIIGPWGHGTFSSYFGDRFFGLDASMTSKDITDLHLEWFDHWLKEKESDMPEVTYFTMGTNEWKKTSRWPLPETEYTPLYLDKNSSLSWSKPSERIKDSFKYDPAHPMPTMGGRTLFFEGVNTGPLAQNKVEKREDHLLYTSAPLREDVEVTGPVNLKLTAISEAKDTDFTAVLTEVLPDGTSIYITDGITRTSTKTGDASERFKTYTISLSSTSIYIKEGSSLRIRISSSSFPQYDVNLNTEETMITSDASVKTTQTVHLAESKLILPLVPTSRL